MLSIICLFFIIILLSHSQGYIASAISGIEQFAFIVLPSIFPFYVLSEILVRSGFCDKTSKLFAPLVKPLFKLSGKCALPIIMGAISGFPAGGKITALMYKEKMITKNEAYVLLSFTNNVSPVFVICVIGGTYMGSIYLGISLFVIQLLSCIVIGCIFGHNMSNRSITSYQYLENKINKRNFSFILSESIYSCAFTMIPIAGSIIFFAALTSVLSIKSYMPVNNGNVINIIDSLIYSFFEITGGLKKLSVCNLSHTVKCLFLSFACGWSGISVHTQVIGIISQSGLSARTYIKGKVLQAFLSALLTYVLLLIY